MLPITRVVLFKHGVGFFQRTGKVSGNENIELGFKSDQMNDVLKSLTTLDYGGGTFAALTYDSEEPIERRLQELNMSIPEKGAIAAFLDNLKGARVMVPRGTEKLEGVIVGIEQVQRAEDGQVVFDSHLAILAEEGKLVRVPLLEVEFLQFLDDTIRRDIRALLDILFSGLRKDRKRFAIQAMGKGERQVSLSYVIEAPVWKTSYRIMLAADKKEKPLLQGWALIDNTTEDDWSRVQLSLVAGLPISFVHDLYTPRYRRRPVVRVEEEAAVAPPVIEAGEAPCDSEVCDEDMVMEEAAKESAAPLRARRASRMEMPMAAAPAPSMAEATRASVQVQTRTQEVGDLFAYEITHPVDVARGRSALVPILQAEADMERSALYNREIREKNPMTAFRIKNTTGLTLEGGPVTVFEGDAYVGEAMLDTMRQNEERITPYSVELGITAKQEVSSVRERYTRATKSGRYISMLYRQLQVTTYEFSSRLTRAVPLYLDHRFSYPVRENTPEPVEITDHFWRFKLELLPQKTTKFPVTEVSEQSESIHIPDIASASIRNLVSNKLISPEVKVALEKIADQTKSIADLRKIIADLERQEKKIASDQGRLRENLQALGDSTDESRLRQKYVSSLSKQEEQLENIRNQMNELRDKVERESERLNEMIDTLKI